MGYEYRLRIPDASRADLEAAFRALPYLETVDATASEYVFRQPANPGRMPDAILRITEDGIYLCSNAGSRFASQLLAAPPASFEDASLEDWE